MVLTDDDGLHTALRQLKDQGRPLRGTGGDDLHPAIGFNFKLTNMQAALGLGQLQDIEDRMDHVRRMYRAYERGLAGLNGITLLPCRMDAGELPPVGGCAGGGPGRARRPPKGTGGGFPPLLAPDPPPALLPPGRRGLSQQHPAVRPGHLAAVGLLGDRGRRGHRLRPHPRFSGTVSNPETADVFLGFYPLVNDFRAADAPIAPEPRYPLTVHHDTASDIVSLGHVPDRRLVFPPDYPYTSGATPSNLTNFQGLAAECGRLLELGPGDLAVDVGCNDGSLLKALAGTGARVHGIEPTNTADMAEAAGVEVTRDFLDRAVAARLREALGPARLVTATNLLAHVPDFAEVAGGCRDLLAEDGILIVEVQYLWSVIETTGIDSVHHEHSRYYGLKGLRNHLAEQGLEVFRANLIPSHGGSLRVFAARLGSRTVEDSVANLLAAEEARGPLAKQPCRILPAGDGGTAEAGISPSGAWGGRAAGGGVGSGAPGRGPDPLRRPR